MVSIMTLTQEQFEGLERNNKAFEAWMYRDRKPKLAYSSNMTAAQYVEWLEQQGMEDKTI